MRHTLKIFGIILILSNTTIAGAADDDLVFLDIYGGYAWNQNQDAESRLPINGTPGTAELEDLGVEDAPIFGGRLGFWFQSRPNLGFAIDATHYDTDINQQTTRLNLSPDTMGNSRLLGINDIKVKNTFVTFDLLYRQRMGRFTPYITAGAGVVVSSLDEGGFFGAGNQDNSDTELAFKAGAGVSYSLSDAMEIFGEYRYLHADPQYELKASIDPVATPTSFVREELTIDIDTHALLGGVSIRF